MGTILKIRCGWCDKDMGEKDGKGQTGTTDGICPECYVKELMRLTTIGGDKRIRYGGYIADPHVAHKPHSANCCQRIISPGDKYFSVVAGGSGVGGFKHPYRCHESCLPMFMARLEERGK